MASKLLHEGFLHKSAVDRKSNWKLRYFRIFKIEGRPPMLQYSVKQGDLKPKGILVLGPGSFAQHEQIEKKSAFGMHIHVFPYMHNDDDGYAQVAKKQKKSMRSKSMVGLPSDLYCYSSSHNDTSRWVREINNSVGLDRGLPPTPLSAQQMNTHEGCLYKKAHNKWDKKYFLLEGTNLMYFDSIAGRKRNKFYPKRVIQLCRPGFPIRCKVAPMPADKKMPVKNAGMVITNVMTIKPHNDRVKYSLCAESAEKCIGWIDAIREALDRARSNLRNASSKNLRSVLNELCEADANEESASEPNQQSAVEPNQPAADEPNQPAADEPKQPAADEPNQPAADEPNEPSATKPEKRLLPDEKRILGSIPLWIPECDEEQESNDSSSLLQFFESIEAINTNNNMYI